MGQTLTSQARSNVLRSGCFLEGLAKQINLPANLERSLQVGVPSGHFASLDEAVAEAVRLLLEKFPAEPEPRPAGGNEPTTPSHKPIWEVFEEITASIPEEEWAKLLNDGAEQHDR